MGRKGVRPWVPLQTLSKDRSQRESLDLMDHITATSRPGSLQFYRFWLISNINIVKDLIEGIVIRGVCILINNR